MKNKIVIYTSIFGNRDNLSKNICIPKNCDFICFTDNESISGGQEWELIKCPTIYEDPSRNAKKYKILPHRYLSKYDFSIYMDGNFCVRDDVNDLIKDTLNDKVAAFYDHNEQDYYDCRNCIYEEGKTIINFGIKNMQRTPDMGIKNFKDDPKIITAQMNRYNNFGYPKNNGLIVGGIIIRKHNDKKCIEVMESWWDEIKYFSKRDQLSFNYIAWTHNFKFNYISGKTRSNKYFFYTRHAK